MDSKRRHFFNTTADPSLQAKRGNHFPTPASQSLTTKMGRVG